MSFQKGRKIPPAANSRYRASHRVVKKRRRGVLWFLFFVLAVSAAVVWFKGCASPAKEVEQDEHPLAIKKEEPSGFLDPLTGLRVKQVISPLAVMVDNLAASRPQTGLVDAGVVYEMEAEGGVTRFLALYAGDPPESVGPVRSSRTCFLQLAQEWDPLYAHVGGSADALANIRAWGINDLDEIGNSQYFRRDRTRKPPHNVYLKVESAARLTEPGETAALWNFGDPQEGEEDCQQLSFSYNQGIRVTYEFSPQEKKYLRSINGTPHCDRVTGERIAVTNVVLQYASHHHRGDALGHIDVNVIGSGKAEFFLAGRYLTGTWEKKSGRDLTRFFDEDGRELTFVRGNTWIQILRPGTSVEKS